VASGRTSRSAVRPLAQDRSSGNRHEADASSGSIIAGAAIVLGGTLDIVKK
jgi:hypothetical protein